MPVWKNSKMDTVWWGKHEPSEGYPCEVKIEGDRIEVWYRIDEEPVCYAGKERAPGHFELRITSPEVEGQATLHRFPDGMILEGYFVEDGDRGFWRVTLGE